MASSSSPLVINNNIITTIIFDLDGTLLDTEALSTKSIELTLNAYIKNEEITIDWPLKKSILGMRGSEWTKVVINNKNVSDKIDPISLESGWEENMKRLCIDVEAINGAPELIKQFLDSDNNIKMAIATSSASSAVAVKRMNHEEAIFRHMDLIVCGDDPELTHGKPHPDIYLLAAKRLNVSPSECLVFEDAVAGVESGTAAGMTVVACPDSRLYHDPAERARFEALTPYIVEKLSDINIKQGKFIS